jgi:hypothetical protein
MNRVGLPVHGADVVRPTRLAASRNLTSSATLRELLRYALDRIEAADIGPPGPGG